MIKQTLHWGFVGAELETAWYKEIELPYIIAPGSTVSLMGYYPVRVHEVSHDLDAIPVDLTMSNVNIHLCDCEVSDEQLLEMAKKLKQNGWTCIDGYGYERIRETEDNQHSTDSPNP